MLRMKPKRPSVGSGSRRGVVERRVRDARLLPVRLRALERVLRDVVAVEGGARERLRHLEQRDAGAAADVGDLDAGLQLLDDARHARQRERHQQRAEPRREAALDAARAFGSERVVGQAEPGLERAWAASRRARASAAAARRSRHRWPGASRRPARRRPRARARSAPRRGARSHPRRPAGAATRAPSVHSASCARPAPPKSAGPRRPARGRARADRRGRSWKRSSRRRARRRRR